MELETRQVQEAVLSLFHTVLFHRTLPKYNFQVNIAWHETLRQENDDSLQRHDVKQ